MIFKEGHVKTLWVIVVAASLSGAVAAQDAKKDDCCGAQGIICPKDGKCEGKCREICDKVGATLKAVRARVGELMQKEVGQKCQCCAGECKGEACSTCETVVSKVYAPLMKERVNARFKDMKKEIKHTVKGEDGKESDVKCTFLTGDICKVCVNDMADASWKKLKEMFAEKK